MQVCGFEALPPDLAVLLAAETARERWGEDLAEADLQVSMSGPPGMPRPRTWSPAAPLRAWRRRGRRGPVGITDPAALIADPATAAEIRRRSPISLAPRRNARGAVIAPMAPSAFINPAVIHRTAALLAAEGGGRGRALPLPRGDRDPGRRRRPLPLRYAAAGALAGMQAGLAR